MERFFPHGNSVMGDGVYNFYGYKLNYSKKKYSMGLSVNRKEHYKIVRETYLNGFNKMYGSRRDIGICPLFKLFYSYGLLSEKRRRGEIVLVVDKQKLKEWLEINRPLEVMRNERKEIL